MTTGIAFDHGRVAVASVQLDEAARDAALGLGDAVFAGCCSHGEIAPFTAPARCERHNQTITTITAISER